MKATLCINVLHQWIPVRTNTTSTLTAFNTTKDQLLCAKFWPINPCTKRAQSLHTKHFDEHSLRTFLWSSEPIIIVIYFKTYNHYIAFQNITGVVYYDATLSVIFTYQGVTHCTQSWCYFIWNMYHISTVEFVKHCIYYWCILPLTPFLLLPSYHLSNYSRSWCLDISLPVPLSVRCVQVRYNKMYIPP